MVYKPKSCTLAPWKNTNSIICNVLKYNWLLFLITYKKTMFSKNDDLREAVTRYEKMLLEHETIFFDSYQYEDIILYYLEYAK